MFTIYCIIGILAFVGSLPYSLERSRAKLKAKGVGVGGQGFGLMLGVCIAAVAWPVLLVWNAYLYSNRPEKD